MNRPKLLLTTICCMISIMGYPQKWIAGTNISTEQITQYGIENCFKAEEIDSITFKRIEGLSYKENCTVPIEELRHLKIVHYNAQNEATMGEIICNKKIADDLIYIFRELFEAKYQIESVRLVDEYGADDNLSMVNNNSSSFNFRYIAGTSKLSKHSLGLAIDINPLYNPYVKQTETKLIIDPIEAREYIDRERDFPYKIDHSDLCYKLFIERGFEWGGDWNSLKDYQHFEWVE